MGKHHFTVENAWYTAPTQGGGPCHWRWEGPVECSLTPYSEVNEVILWLTWQPSTIWISWSNITTTHLQMLQNHWPVIFKAVSHKSHQKNSVCGNGSTLVLEFLLAFDHFVSLVFFWAYPFLYLILSFPKILQIVRFIWNQLCWNTF